MTTNPNADVLRTYDVMYALLPLQQAVCTKDSNGKYCVTEITNPSSTSDSSGQVDAAVIGSSSPDISSVKQYLWSQTSYTKRATAQTVAMIPNVTTFRQSNLLFFFLTPQTASATLCTTCTRNMLMSYFDFEQSVPYAPGLGNSPLMGGQLDLYNHVASACGKTFLGGAVEAAGSISSGLVGGQSAAPRSASQSFVGIVSALMGTVAIAIL